MEIISKSRIKINLDFCNEINMTFFRQAKKLKNMVIWDNK